MFMTVDQLSVSCFLSLCESLISLFACLYAIQRLFRRCRWLGVDGSLERQSRQLYNLVLDNEQLLPDIESPIQPVRE